MFWVIAISYWILSVSCQVDLNDEQIKARQKTPTLPFKCSAVGLYPDPYDCQSYYNCEKVLDLPRDDPWLCPFGTTSVETKCVIATERCSCPNGTFWAGPSAGCISDANDREACCSFQPDCVHSNSGNFKECSLSNTGFFYSCRGNFARSSEKRAITVERFKNTEIYNTSKPNATLVKHEESNEINPYKKENKILLVCTSLRDIVPETDQFGETVPDCSLFPLSLEKEFVIRIYNDGTKYWACDAESVPRKREMKEGKNKK